MGKRKISDWPAVVHDYEAFLLLEEVIAFERERAYFRHFFPEVLSFARGIVRNHLAGTLSDELGLDCLEAGLELGFGKRDEAVGLGLRGEG